LKRVLEEFCFIFGVIRYVTTPLGKRNLSRSRRRLENNIKAYRKISEWKPMGGNFEHGYESWVSAMAGNLQTGSIINC
jgi:hypothetical protein